VPALEKINSQAELDKVNVTLDTALFDAYNHRDMDKSARHCSQRMWSFITIRVA
jgi:hypothetical protein